MSFPGLFDAWGKQVIAGIGWELVKESVELDGGKLPNFAKVPQRHWQNQVYTNQFLYAILAEEKCAQAGVRDCFLRIPTRQSRRQTMAGRLIALGLEHSDESAANRSSIALAELKLWAC